jgi:hypothetical protein
MLNLFQHLTYRMTLLVGCRNKFGMTSLFYTFPLHSRINGYIH